jgi:hypothetical protein
MKKNESILLRGKFILRAWKPGILSHLLKRMPYRMAFGKMPRAALMKELSVENLIVTVGKEMVADWLRGADTPGSLTYHAIGTGSTSPSVSDEALAVEAARVAFASRTRTSNVITLSAFYPSGDCSCHIQEVGVFGGAASATPGSGTLMSRALLDYDNSGGTYDLTFDYNLTVGG